MDVFIGVLYGIYGLLVGSFLNVCIYRIPRRVFWQSAHSYCPNCHTQLKWYELVPLFSYLFLGGRCRTCKERISVRYPLVEGGNMLLWILVYLVYGFSWYSVALCILFSILLVVSCIDLDIMEIPDGLIVAIAILGVAPFVASFFAGNSLPSDLPWWGYLVGIVSVSVPFFLIALITRGAIGGGDIKLMAALGLFCGWRIALLGAFFGVILGGLMGIVMMLIFGRNRRAMMPLAPALALGAVIALLWGEPIIGAFTSAFIG